MIKPIARYSISRLLSQWGLVDDTNGKFCEYREYASVAADNERLREALKDVERAWYHQRPGDVIRIVDKAFEKQTK